MEDLVEEEAQSEKSTSEQASSIRELLVQARALADELAARPNLGLNTAPKRELERFSQLGLLTAVLPVDLGGLALGLESGTHLTLLRLLAIAGGADLALGRIFEGHVNAILLVHRYGTPQQMQVLAEGCHAGMLSGVWNTGAQQLLRLRPTAQGYEFSGCKTFATGAAFVKRPIVTAELEGAGWQMTMPSMEMLGASLDRCFWHPLGMESSESFQVDFTGCNIDKGSLIGKPGDFYRDPMFRGGAVRFAAVQAGAVLRLHAMFTTWLETLGRTEDPYQIARLGEVAVLAQEGALWIEKAATVSEQSFYKAEKPHVEHMTECANMMRVAIEQKATRVMQLITVGVGAHGMLQPHRFERVIRDLTMYLRQPAPDQAVASIGRTSIQKASRRANGTEWGFWSEEETSVSLPAHYFQKIYARKQDPWDFETSSYEREKYQTTIDYLPRPIYESALEIGCSIGVLTAKLASRTRHLLGLDVSEKALEQARLRCIDMQQVQFECMVVPDQMPAGPFDLVIVSEVAYYWSSSDLIRAADAVAAHQLEAAHLVLVHLTEDVPDYPLTGDEVHEYWISRPEWTLIKSMRSARYRLDVLERSPMDRVVT